ncbi:MAG: hypothetical protein NWE93_10990 [Candidatus Bathyarchaeota archaeon]|nr:hypothetical protein [Candidatus Bathyarchaeota archaeon]
MQKWENLLNVTPLHWSKNDGVRYLTEIGLTRIQASLYLNLVINGKADARLLASRTSLPRTGIYRALNELQENGLVDKEVGNPIKFSAVPPQLGLQAFIDRKYCEVKEMRRTLKEFSSEFKAKKEQESEKDYKISIIEGRKRIFAQMKQQHDNAKSKVDVVTFLPRFLHVANECQDNHDNAVARGVKYRLIIGLPDQNQAIPNEILKTHDKNTTIKTVLGNQMVNFALFDHENMSFSYYPDRPIAESPYVITNHPCLVAFAENAFEQLWNSL